MRLLGAGVRGKAKRMRRLFHKQDGSFLSRGSFMVRRIEGDLSGGLSGQREARKQLEKVLDPGDRRGQPQRNLPAIA